MATIKYRLGNILDGDQTLSWAAKIQKKDARKPNLLKFQILQSVVPQLNDEVKYYDLDNVQVFGGYIQNISDSTGVQNVAVGDYSIKLSQERFSAVYENMSPEAIIEDIITNHTELTYVSTVSTGITITKRVFKDEWIMDVLTKLLELFNGTYKVDLSKNFNMRLNAENTSTEDLIFNLDVLDGAWQTDITKKAEKVIVLGAVIDQRTTETLTGTAQTEFTTTFKPENVEINGFQQTTEDITGDFTVNIQDKKITFNSVQTDPVISYTYKSQVRVELGTGKTVILEKKYIESKTEARRLATEYHNRFVDGSQSSKWIKNSSDINQFNVGDLIYVEDEINDKTGNYEITKVTLELPKKLIIEIGEGESDLFDWQKETIERIKQLETTNSDAEFISLYDYISKTMNVNISVSFDKLQTVTDAGEILFASETTLATGSDLISDTGVDADFALAYDDDYLPVRFVTDYLNPDVQITTAAGDSFTTEDGFIIVE